MQSDQAPLKENQSGDAMLNLPEEIVPKPIIGNSNPYWGAYKIHSKQFTVGVVQWLPWERKIVVKQTMSSIEKNRVHAYSKKREENQREKCVKSSCVWT